MYCRCGDSSSSLNDKNIDTWILRQSLVESIVDSFFCQGFVAQSSRVYTITTNICDCKKCKQNKRIDIRNHRCEQRLVPLLLIVLETREWVRCKPILHKTVLFIYVVCNCRHLYSLGQKYIWIPLSIAHHHYLLLLITPLIHMIIPQF
jgi:hypothetical protein